MYSGELESYGAVCRGEREATDQLTPDPWDDTGSPEVQVAMLTERISRLSSHLQKNNHDFSSRQGLLKMIGRRKRLLSYMRGKSEQRYSDLISKLGIRG